MAECAVTCISIITCINLVCHEYGIKLLLSVRITSEICLLTATLADKDNPSSDALLSDNVKYIAKKLLLKAVSLFLMACRGIYSTCTCSVSKSHNQNTNIK